MSAKTPRANDVEPPESPEPAGSPGARRKAMVILEVLGGMRTPTAAAEELGIPAPRYYQWEERAVAGMVSALEPRKRGPKRDPHKEIDDLRDELEASRKECARYEALLRSAERTIGLSREAPKSGRSKKRTRRPSVRALTAIEKIARKEKGEEARG